MRWGMLLTPWRVARHSLFICALSLTIATGAVVAGAVLQRGDTPSYPRASASMASQESIEIAAARAPQQRGESTSIGALTRFVKSAGASPTAASEASAADSGSTTDPAAGEQGEAAETAPADDAPQSDARVSSALTNAVPMLMERPAETGDLVVTSARFKVQPTPTISEATVRTQTAAPSVPELQAGDRITVPVTFYYCEDSTGGQRAGDGGGFCGVMRDGTAVYPGAAACEYRYLGQRFVIEGDPTGRTYVCADTGSGIHGQHRDIWFMSSGEGWAWQQVVGRSAVIRILQ
ncbi:MAG: hypothetical protein AB7I38_00425 [Dehalococcoidia bacterium]